LIIRIRTLYHTRILYARKRKIPPCLEMGFEVAPLRIELKIKL
jgi:hypothetical protein